MSFQQHLRQGKLGESAIARWLNRRGNTVLPVYEIEPGQYRGPVVFAPGEQLVAPDMIAFRVGRVVWIEAKHKSAFTWHRKTARWVTGIDLPHYQDYIRVGELSGWPVYLAFLQRNGEAKDTPPGMKSPTGLYLGELAYLQRNENHRSMEWGRAGMVYWAESTLTKKAELAEVL